MRHAILAIAALAVLAGRAAAQPYTPPSHGPSIGVRVYAAVDADMMAASESFKAAFGTERMTAVGGGGEVDVWKHLFVRVAATRARKAGSRVFVDTGEVFDLGIPMTVTLTPIEAGGGWRFASRSRVATYVGASFVSLGYEQVSDFAQAGENVSERFTGAEGFGGVAIAIGKGLFVGAEAKFRRVNAPADSRSLMAEFKEKDLGGVSARIVIGFSTK